MASARPDQFSVDEDASQKRTAMDAMLDSNAAALELLNEFVRVQGEEDCCPKEAAALAREAYDNLVYLGLSPPPQVLSSLPKRSKTSADRSSDALLPSQQPVTSQPGVHLTSWEPPLGLPHTGLQQTHSCGSSGGWSMGTTLLSCSELPGAAPLAASLMLGRNAGTDGPAFPFTSGPWNRAISVSGPEEHAAARLRPFGAVSPLDPGGPSLFHSQCSGPQLRVAGPPSSLACMPYQAQGLASQGTPGGLLRYPESLDTRAAHLPHNLMPVVTRPNGRGLGEPLDSRSSIDSLGSRGSKGALGSRRDSQSSQGGRGGAMCLGGGALEERRGSQGGLAKKSPQEQGECNNGLEVGKPRFPQIVRAAAASSGQGVQPDLGSSRHQSEATEQVAGGCKTAAGTAFGQADAKGPSQAEKASGRLEGILSGSSLLTELRLGSRAAPTTIEFPDKPGRAAGAAGSPLKTVRSAGRQASARRLASSLRHSIGDAPMPLQQPCDREGKHSLLEQLLRDAMGNLSAEQEAALMAEVADKAAAVAPSSPNSRMREESMLAGLGVIAPEEIGLKRIKSAPPREAGLLAQLKARTENERLVRETPSPSSEGNLFLAKLRSMSSSDDARNGSAALSNGSLHRVLSHRDGSLLSQLRPQVAWEAAMSGLGGRHTAAAENPANRLSSGFGEGGSAAPVPLGHRAAACSASLGFGSGSVAIQAARGRSDEAPLAGSGNAVPLASRGASPSLDTFGSGSVAAEIARSSSVELSSPRPSPQRFSSGQVAADLAKSGALEEKRASGSGPARVEDGGAVRVGRSPTTKAGNTIWRVQSGGSAQCEAAMNPRPSQPSLDAAKVTSRFSAAGIAQPVASTSGRRVPPLIPISRFSLEGAPGWMPSPPHSGTSPPRTSSAGQDDSGGSRERSNKLQSRSSLHSKSSIQSQPSFHSWAGPSGTSLVHPTTDSPQGARGEAVPFTARWGKASATLEFPHWPKSARRAKAGYQRTTRDMPPPASPAKTHSSEGSPRGLPDFGAQPSHEVAKSPSDRGSPSGAGSRPPVFSRQQSPDPLQPRSPETGSGSASPSGARQRTPGLTQQQAKEVAPECMEDFTNGLLREYMPAPPVPWTADSSCQGHRPDEQHFPPPSSASG